MKKLSNLILVTLLLITLLSGCEKRLEISSLSITNCDKATLELGESLQLLTDAPNDITDELTWESSSTAVRVDGVGLITACETGLAAVTVSYGEHRDVVLITVVPSTDATDEVPEGYATSYEDALARSAKGQLSGDTDLPDQAPEVSHERPTYLGAYIRNSEPWFADENTYVVVDAEGEEVFRIYRGGGYITIEEVAAYVYAFGEVPANYVASKSMEPEESIWGKHLRLNHTEFSGDTDRYPYEPELPNISGCGGELTYYEIDIGTTGTDCDPSYPSLPYNNGSTITRGAARIVYTRYDRNGDKIIDPNEKYLFYTYNHYNDFQEYLGYYGGWGEMFGNITGGGSISSRYDYNPTDYVEAYLAPLDAVPAIPAAYLPSRRYFLAA